MEDLGYVTASDAAYFPGLKLLVKSIHKHTTKSVFCADLGLTDDQRRWCQANFVKTGKLRHHYFNDTRVSKMWSKPWAFTMTPWRYNIWIDADAVMVRPCLDLERHVRTQGFFATEFFKDTVLNPPELYKVMPVDYPVKERPINAGVLGLDRMSDAPLLAAWIRSTERAIHDNRVAQFVRYREQGTLLWTMASLGMSDRVLGKKWNWPVDTGKKSRFDANEPMLLDWLPRWFPRAHIVHWVGTQKAFPVGKLE